MDQIARQLEELEVLESMFPGEKEIEIDQYARKAAEKMMEQTGSTLTDLPLLHCTLYFQEYAIDDHVPQLAMVFPHTYPYEDVIQLSFFFASIPLPQLDQINHRLIELAETLCGHEATLEIYQQTIELLEPIYNEAKSHHDLMTEEREEEEKEEEKDQAVITPPQFSQAIQFPPVLGRRAIYFHHIIANSKRKAVMDWACALHLSGYSKIGWPGIVIIEGPEICCQEYVRHLQHLRWKQMVVRGEQTEHGPVDELRKLPPMFQEFPPDGMSSLAAACREHGLEDLFLSTMKIYARKTKVPSTKSKKK